VADAFGVWVWGFGRRLRHLGLTSQTEDSTISQPSHPHTLTPSHPHTLTPSNPAETSEITFVFFALYYNDLVGLEIDF
jgi:hypothetical protein